MEAITCPFSTCWPFSTIQFVNPPEDGGDDLTRIELAYDASFIEAFPLLCRYFNYRPGLRSLQHHFVVHHSPEGQVDQNHSESDGNQQKGFHFLGNCQIYEYERYRDHQGVSPVKQRETSLH
jgi:hypothetical protein